MHQPISEKDERDKQIASTSRQYIGERISLSSSQLYIPSSEYQRYNKELDEFFVRHERSLREQNGFDNLVNRSVRESLVISNTGSAPAIDVDVWIHFPDGFVLLEESDFPRRPHLPSLPVNPQTRGQMLADRMDISTLNLRLHFNKTVGPVSHFQVKETNSFEVTEHVDRLKHGYKRRLPDLLLCFPS